MTYEIHHGDALAVLRSLPSESVDAVLTDPPYSSGGMFRGDRQQDVHTKYVNSDSESGNAMAAFTGDSRDQRSYGYWVALWLGECLRIVKPGGVAALFTDWRQLPATSDALQAGGWVWRGVVPWHKPNGRPVQGRWANSCEYVVWGTNGPRDLLALDGAALPGFYQASPPREREHITQKPVEVMQSLMRIVPRGGVVLDPFCGSGTTGVAALLEGRSFIGCEMSEHFVEVARRRCAEAATQGQQGSLLELAAAPEPIGTQTTLIEPGEAR
jgi:site-specific DNA-methyltransferase (adenine-specific)